MFIRTRNNQNHQLVRSVRSNGKPKHVIIASWTGDISPSIALTHEQELLAKAEARLSAHVGKYTYGPPWGKRGWFHMIQHDLEAEIVRRNVAIEKISTAMEAMARTAPPAT